MTYRYETHCHTSPVSACAGATPEETVAFYKALGYDGVFITNHFLDGNICPDARSMRYEEQIDFYFSDYRAALAEGARIGIKVFPGVELSYEGTDFLIYGLNKAWYKAHPEILHMEKREELAFLASNGAFVVQAHPYREAGYIDHIRLFPRSVHAVEIVNTSQCDEANEMARLYARHYHLLTTAGSDNHHADGYSAFQDRRGLPHRIAGMKSRKPVNCVEDFIRMVKSGELKVFVAKG